MKMTPKKATTILAGVRELYDPAADANGKPAAALEDHKERGEFVKREGANMSARGVQLSALDATHNPIARVTGNRGRRNVEVAFTPTPIRAHGLVEGRDATKPSRGHESVQIAEDNACRNTAGRRIVNAVIVSGADSSGAGIRQVCINFRGKRRVNHPATIGGRNCILRTRQWGEYLFCCCLSIPRLETKNVRETDYGNRTETGTRVSKTRANFRPGEGVKSFPSKVRVRNRYRVRR